MKAFVFPGQGAQFPGMGKDLYETYDEAKEMFLQANHLLNFSITDVMFGDDSEVLKETKITQPAIFLHSVILAKILGNKFKPDFVIDLATLTGAIISALGKERAGLFSNNDNLSEYIFQTGEKIENLVWKMPMDKIYGQKMLSKIADLKNIGTPEGSSIQAAAFLQNFVGRTSWAHLDVAGVVWSDRVSDIHSGGATGWGVRLLFEIAKNNYRF